MSYLSTYNTRRTPQHRPIPGSRTPQVENSAGGFAWSVDKWTRLNRFLILGSQGGSYYASELKLTTENADVVLECIAADGKRTVATIVQISQDGRAPNNDPAIFALAMCAGKGDDATRRYALDSLPEVCRIGTHLFHFATFVEQFRGWGRGLRKAVADWYLEKNIDELAYDVIKYRQRDGWSHRDLLRLAHPQPRAEDQADAEIFEDGSDNAWLLATLRGDLFSWIVGKGEGETPPAFIEGYEYAQRSPSALQTARLVREYNLPREALKTEHLADPVVWEALLNTGMPMGALLRNLATMTRNGTLKPLSSNVQLVVDKLGDADQIRKARIHPIDMLKALATYGSGRSVRGDNAWTPIPQIIDALDAGFYTSFGNVKPTGKRHLLALDVSGSMTMGEIGGMPGLTPRVASAAMALVTANIEPNYMTLAFSGGLMHLPFSKGQRLDDACRMVDKLPFDRTDCALPMMGALHNQIEVDTFVIYTDSETWSGQIHPKQALDAYRQKMGIDARLVVVGMVSNGFSIADPNDPGMLDVVGFDTATPNLISGFADGAF